MRYEAVFDYDDAVWRVVDWYRVDANDNRVGRIIEQFTGTDAEEYANGVADYYNDMLANPFEIGCEFDGKLA
jgi:hypothetical protein